MSAPGDAIAQALLAYQRAPGKHTLGLRQPAVLFASLKEVLQLAAGRAPDGPAAPALQHAAVFFLKSALLAPGADHYTLLGLPRDADSAAIKERYRLLMRLLHPDFAATLPGAAWPPDAAARVNQAHEVLMSPAHRRRYDEQLQGAKPQPAPAHPQPRRTQVAIAAAAKPRAADPRLLLKRLAAGFGAAGVLALLAALFANLQERPELVQRADGEGARAPGKSTARARSDAEAAALAAILAERPGVPLAGELPRPPEPVAPRAAALPPPAPQAPAQPAAAFATAAMPPAVAPAALANMSPAPAPVPLPLNAPVTAPAVVAAAAPAPAPASANPQAAARPVAAPAARPNPGITMAEVHPLLSQLLQHLESGAGERMLGLLERDARAAPGAQALLRHYNGLVEGAHQVKVANAQFRAEPQDGRLVVTGLVLMQVGDGQAAATPKEFAMQAEFVARGGTVVMTQLARALPASDRRP